MKINLGCGLDILPGYINYDLNSLKADVLGDAKCLPFKDGTIEEIFASHLLEHFHFQDGKIALGEWWRVLKQDGTLILELPDLLATCKAWVDKPHYNGGPIIGIYGFPWVKGHAHQMGYSPEQLFWVLQSTGFTDIVKKPTTRHTDWGDLNMRFEARKI